MDNPRQIGTNIARMLAATGGWIHLETHHGALREGRLSGWVYRTMKLNGVDVQLPVSLELNGDVYDTVNLVDIKKMEIL